MLEIKISYKELKDLEAQYQEELRRVEEFEKNSILGFVAKATKTLGQVITTKYFTYVWTIVGRSQEFNSIKRILPSREELQAIFNQETKDLIRSSSFYADKIKINKKGEVKLTPHEVKVILEPLISIQNQRKLIETGERTPYTRNDESKFKVVKEYQNGNILIKPSDELLGYLKEFLAGKEPLKITLVD